jgi:hypothetical protein
MSSNDRKHAYMLQCRNPSSRRRGEYSEYVWVSLGRMTRKEAIAQADRTYRVTEPSIPLEKQRLLRVSGVPLPTK